MKGRTDQEAAAIEAEQEAGRIGKKPISAYTYWKRRADHFNYCRVKVFVLEVRDRLPNWREKSQRRGAWLLVREAAELVDEYGRKLTGRFRTRERWSRPPLQRSPSHCRAPCMV